MPWTEDNVNTLGVQGLAFRISSSMTTAEHYFDHAVRTKVMDTVEIMETETANETT